MSLQPDQPELRPLLDWVLAQYPDTSKTRAKEWITAGRVSVKGEIIRQPHRLLPPPGEGLKLLERRALALDCGTGWKIHPRVSLLYLDTALAIIDKGSGVVSVPAANAELSALGILQDFLVGRLRPTDHRRAGKPLPSSFRRLTLLPVHRLDQYTTGIFCAACSPSARQNLVEQVRNHSMQREYVAFVEGEPSSPKGTWRHVLSLSPDELHQRVLDDHTRGSASHKTQEAVTHYQVVETFRLAGSGVVTKLRLRLETGLRHQIRVQSAQVGLPLIGERKYRANPGHSKATPPAIEFPRQALHAISLTLRHPDDSSRILSWEAPLPKDLRQLEHFLRQGGKSAEPAGGPRQTSI